MVCPGAHRANGALTCGSAPPIGLQPITLRVAVPLEEVLRRQTEVRLKVTGTRATRTTATEATAAAWAGRVTITPDCN
jgi:hypothetical protein